MAGKTLKGNDLNRIRNLIAGGAYARGEAVDRKDDSLLKANAVAWATGLGSSLKAKGQRLIGDNEGADTTNRLNNAMQASMQTKDAELSDMAGGYIPEGLIRGARNSAIQMPEMLAAGMAGGLPAVIAQGVASEANQASTAGRDAGLEGKQLAQHVAGTAAIEGTVTGLFSALGGPIGGGIESGIANLLRQSGRSAIKSPATKKALAATIARRAGKAGLSLTAESAEELTIGYLSALENVTSGVDPTAMEPEALMSMASDTLYQTVAMTAMMGGLNQAQQSIMRRGGKESAEKRQKADEARKAVNDQVIDQLDALLQDGKPRTAGELEADLEDAGIDLRDPEIQELLDNELVARRDGGLVELGEDGTIRGVVPAQPASPKDTTFSKIPQDLVDKLWKDVRDGTDLPKQHAAIKAGWDNGLLRSSDDVREALEKGLAGLQVRYRQQDSEERGLATIPPTAADQFANDSLPTLSEFIQATGLPRAEAEKISPETRQLMMSPRAERLKREQTEVPSLASPERPKPYKGKEPIQLPGDKQKRIEGPPEAKTTKQGQLTWTLPRDDESTFQITQLAQDQYGLTAVDSETGGLIEAPQTFPTYEAAERYADSNPSVRAMVAQDQQDSDLQPSDVRGLEQRGPAVPKSKRVKRDGIEDRRPTQKRIGENTQRQKGGISVLKPKPKTGAPKPGQGGFTQVSETPAKSPRAPEKRKPRGLPSPSRTTVEPSLDRDVPDSDPVRDAADYLVENGYDPEDVNAMDDETVLNEASEVERSQTDPTEDQQEGGDSNEEVVRNEEGRQETSERQVEDGAEQAVVNEPSPDSAPTKLTDEELEQKALDAMFADDDVEPESPVEIDSSTKPKSGLRKKISDKKKEAQDDYERDAESAIDAFRDLGLLSTVPLSPAHIKALKATAKMMVSGVRVRGWGFAEIVADLADKLGESTIPKIRPYLEKGWKAIAESEGIDTKNMAEVLDKYEPQVVVSPSPEHPERVIAHQVAGMIRARQEITQEAFFKMADEAFGGTRSNGVYGDSQAYDALELGVNMALAGRTNPGEPTGGAKSMVAFIEKVMSKVPRHKARTGEKDTMQQFSTPPAYAYVATWAANITADDVMLEPSGGMGGIAIHAKNGGATVVVNELDENRMKGLAQLPFDHFYNEDAEQIDAILAGKHNITTVVMNPPFSRAGRRMGNRKISGTDRKHMDAALRLLPDGGRLVAIVGAGLFGETKGMSNWLANSPHQIRANVTVARNVYRGYGTEYPTRVLIIDKMPKAEATQPTVSGEAGDLSELIDLLEGVRNDRPIPRPRTVEQDAAQPPSQAGNGASGNTRGPTVDARPSSDSMVPGNAGQTGSGGTSVGGSTGSGNQSATGNAGGSNAVNRPSGGGRLGGRKGGKSGNANAGGRRDGDGSQTGGKPDGRSGTGSTVKAESVADSDRKRSELSEGTYEPYQPSVRIPGAKAHPAPIVESAAMSAVSSPKIDYQISIPAETIAGYTNANGEQVGISDIQLEAVAQAGHAHSQMLPNGERRGYLIGDGTGVGKAREAAGVIMDNWNKGNRKAIWISKNGKLAGQAKEEWERVGGDPDDVKLHANIKSGHKITDGSGIYFATYGALSQSASPTAKAEGNTLSRVDQMVDWLGEDFDGVIIFDEAHLMGNAVKSGEGLSKKSASQRALAGVDLQDRLPLAKIVYMSATAATEVHNLAYAKRLGLWGDGTAFADSKSFIDDISSGGVAAMEVASADMKAMGMYTARNLAFNDGTPEGTVEFERITHEMTPDQSDSYNKAAEGWQVVLRNLNEAIDLTGATGRAKAAAVSQFWSANQRFWNQVVTASMVPSMIQGIEKDLAEGRSALIQLTSTNEAATQRAINRKGEDETLDDIDTSPRYILMDFLERSFPTNRYEEYEDENGNVRTRPVLDNDGNPVQDPEAVALKNAMLDQMAGLQIADRGAIDMVIDHFGEDMVAEITGRSSRIGREEGVSVMQKRGKRATESDKAAFMDGRKRILVFSEAGGTGASYHADRTKKNQQRRAHYVIQAGWRADVAVQGLGRGHRSNQASAPIIKLMQPNLNGYKRFISTIARRLSQLGALTKGQRQAGDSGVFAASDNLESTEAKQALQSFFEDSFSGQIEGIDRGYLSERMGLDIAGTDGNLKANLPPVGRFLNRILNLPIDEQNRVFDEFQNRLDSIVETAIRNGTLDQGMETIKAVSIEKTSEQVVNVHPTGAETKHVVLKVTKDAALMPWSVVAANYMKDAHSYVRSARTGKVFVAVDMRQTEQDSQGRQRKRLKMIGVDGSTYNNDVALQNIDNWTELTPKEAQDLWNAQHDSHPGTTEKEIHLLTGALLPIWNKLPSGNTQVRRALTTDGEQVLGREIPTKELKKTLGRLGANFDGPTVTAADGMQAVRGGGNLELSNGWKIKKSRVDGEERIEIVGPGDNNVAETQRAGGFVTRIGYKMRHFLPYNDDGALQKILDSGRSIDAVNQPERSTRSLVRRKPKGSDMGLSPRESLGVNNQTPDAPVGTVSDPAGVAAADIIKTMSRIFGTTIRTGSMRTRALGEYMGISQSQNVERSTRLAERAATSLAVTVHEIGHHIDRDNAMTTDTPAKKTTLSRVHRRELEGMDYSPEGRADEGFAEFIRKYLTEPNEMDADGNYTSGVYRDAPKFAAHFENVILAENPTLAKQLSEAKGYLDQFANQSIVSKMRAMIGARPGDDLNAGQRFLSNARKQMQNVKRSMIEDIEVAGRMDKFLKAAGRNGMVRDFIYAHRYAATSEADRALSDGVHDLGTGERIGKKAFWKRVQGLLKSDQERKDAALFAYMRHTVWSAQTKPEYNTGIDPVEAQRVLDSIRKNDPDQYKRFEEISRAISDVAHDLLYMRVAAGTMSKRTADKIVAIYGDNYFPMFRVQDKGVAVGGNGNSYVNLPVGVPGRSNQGSGKPVQDPFESISQMAVDYYGIAARGRINEYIHDNFDPMRGGVEGAGWVVTRLDPKMKKLGTSTYANLLGQMVEAGYIDREDADASIVAGQLLGTIDGQPSGRRLEAFAKRHGIEPFDPANSKDMGMLYRAAEQEPDPAQQLELWKPTFEAEPGKMIAVSYEDGNPVLYQYDTDVYRMLTDLDRDHLLLTIPIIRRMSRLFKGIAVGWNASFAVANAAIDYFTYQGRAKNVKGFRSLTEPIRQGARYAYLYKRRQLMGRGLDKMPSEFILYDQMGGSNMSRLGASDTGRRRLVRRKLAVSKWAKFGLESRNPKDIVSGLGDTLKGGIEFVEDIVSMSDAPPRLAEMTAFLQSNGFTPLTGGKWIDPSGKTVESLPEEIRIGAMAAAANATINFKRGGSFMKELDVYVPFARATMNAGVHQVGAVTNMRNLLENSDEGAQARRYAIYLASTAAMSAIYYAMRHDDEDYKNAEAHDLNKYWLFGANGRTLLRIPKSRDEGIVANLVEIGMDMAYGDVEPRAIAETLISDATGRIPAGGGLVRGLVEVGTNKDYFRDRAIEPEYLQERSTQFIYGDKTRDLSIVAGKLSQYVGLSPMQTEHLLNSMTAGQYEKLHRLAEGISDGNVPGSSVPGLRSIYVNRHASRPISDFYDRFGDLMTQIADAKPQGIENTPAIQKAKADLSRMKQYQELLSDIQTAQINDPGDKYKYVPYIVGLSRDALGYDPVASSPNPLTMDPQQLPASVNAALESYVKRTVTTAMTLKNIPSKVPAKAPEGTTFATVRSNYRDQMDAKLDYLESQKDSPAFEKEIRLMTRDRRMAGVFRRIPERGDLTAAEYKADFARHKKQIERVRRLMKR